MALDNVITLSITRQSRPLERAGFGTLLHMSMHEAWDDLIRYYDKASDMLADGFSSTDPAYMAAASYFAQDPKPEQIAIGRVAVADAVKVIIDEVVEASRYTVWIDGCGFEYSSDASPTTIEIEAGLTAVINDGYTVTAASTGDDSFTIAGNHVAAFPVGKQFRVTGATSNNGTYTVASAVISSGSTVISVDEAVPSAAATLGVIKSLTAVTATNTLAGDGEISVSPDVASTFVQITAGTNLHLQFDMDGTIAASYAAIKAEDETGWYAVALAHQWESTESPAAASTQADLEELLADQVELDRKIFGIASPEANIIDTTKVADDVTSGSIARRLQDKGYTRSFTLYSGQADNGLDVAGGDPDPYADVAWFGARLTSDPGRETWKFAKLTGVTADDLTATQRANALAKHCNIFTPFTSSRAITEEGVMADGEYIDIIRLSDQLYDSVINEVAEALLNPISPLQKTPYTAEGIATIEAAIRAGLDPYVGTTRGLAAYTVIVPDIDDVSATDKGNRALTGVEFVATITGAIHTVAIAGNVTW